ncbi:MAG TPA: NAD(P)/FAD-dependent oxidoreductase [Actinocrinis sp.]|nr:NAD(P)/FAD-dependent oxidoreductase [Actinocrinis sp.]
MRILIVGGAIAGSAAALALHKAGFAPVVYEAHPDSAEDLGAFLTLASNGMRALAQIDAAHIVAQIGFPLSRLRVLDASGASIADTPLGEHQHPLTQYRCLRRADLAVALQREVARRGISIRHEARLHSFSEDSDGVTARFTDGRSVTGDLLIGADGLNSTVRPLISDGHVEPHYAGQRVFYGYTADAPAEPSGGITMIRATGAAFGYACSPGGETFWFARVSGPSAVADEIALTTPQQWRDQLVPLLRPDNTPAADIVQATTSQLMLTNACDLSPGITWRTPRALIIGDAAHAASPATGQGASMALEDAVVLAKALRDAPTISAALTAYENVRRPRVEHNIVVSAALTAGRRPSPQAGPQPADSNARVAPLSDDDLVRQLDWTTPLTA